jgi:hypothetical protein
VEAFSMSDQASRDRKRRSIAGQVAQLAREASTLNRENERLRRALMFYGNPENWRFTHDEAGNLLWVTSIGPVYAQEILDGASIELPNKIQPGDGTLHIETA